MLRLWTLFSAATVLSSCTTNLLPFVASYTPSVPRIIQGGMGVRISNWKLAREVSLRGELGVISGTVMDVVMVRELQNGDPDGAMRRALASFPDQDMATRVLDKYYIDGGKDPIAPYKNLPMWTTTPSQWLLEVAVLANYCEVWLAKHNDNGTPIEGIVGINLLTKVQLPTVPSLYGAMLADVDYVLMGAGIPMHIPGILDNLADCKGCEHKIETIGVANTQDLPVLEFSPVEFWQTAGKPRVAQPLRRPAFVPIVSSVVLAQSMLKRASGQGPTKGIQGFVVELNTAGGHNAPPRGFRFDPVAKTHAVDLNDRGEPVYGLKDEVDLAKFSKATNGLPFWLAGSYARPEMFREAVEYGAAGVQVGTVFALCEESGMDDSIKQDILRRIAATSNDKDESSSDSSCQPLQVFTDPAASPTGFPFKVLELEHTLSQESTYASRPRVCNLGYLRQEYLRPDNGKVGYRCPAEPVQDWVKKGGQVEATVGRKCLCNALAANAGFAQVVVVPPTKRNNSGSSDNNSSDNNSSDDPLSSFAGVQVEPMLITTGDDVSSCRPFLKQNEQSGKWHYSAGDVVDYLLSEWRGNDPSSPSSEVKVSATKTTLTEVRI